MLTKTQSRIKPPVWMAIDRTHPLARSLAACWLLNEGAGRTVRDATGRRRDGVFSGNPVWSAGSLGSAVAFDGADDWISMGDCQDLGTDDISVLAIVKYSVANQPDDWSGTRIGAVAGKGYVDGAGRGYGLFVDTDNRLDWQVRNQSSVFTVLSNAALNDGCWHQAVGVCDRDDSSGVRLYIDGLRQNATADATSLNGVDVNGSRDFAIGSRQDENSGAWFWDFAGSVAMVCVWKRVLSEAEIRRLQQNPFEMFTARRAATMFQPAGSVASCEGSIQTVASTSATMQVVRSLCGAIHASASTHGVLDVPGEVSLSGTARGSSVLRGSLSVAPAPPRSGSVRRTEPVWQQEVLFHGRTHAAFELGTVLTRGWFWARRAGCAVVYRGPSLDEVDWTRILCVVKPGAREIALPRHLPHVAGSTECYVIRRFDHCGRQDKTLGAATRLRFASDGRLAPPSPNAIVELAAERIAEGRIRLTWIYCPLDQDAAPAQFHLYRADADGNVDPDGPIGIVRYAGPRCYCLDVPGPVTIRYAFVVRAASAAGTEGRSAIVLVHPIADRPPASIAILAASTF